MFNFWKLAYKSVKEQRDQHKVELLQCKSELHYYRDELESYKTNLKQRNEENEKLRERNKKLEKRCNQKVRRNVRGGLQQMKIEDLESKCDGMKTENEQLKEERESMISDFQKKLDLVRMLKDENRKLETLKIAFQISYKQVYEGNEKLERENEELRSRLDEFLEHDYDNQKLYEEMKRDNRELKDKIERLK